MRKTLFCLNSLLIFVFISIININLSIAKDTIKTVADETFKFQCKKPLSDRNDLACSNPGNGYLASYWRTKFKPACEKHDVCYMAPWRAAGYDGVKGKEKCDNAFKKDLDKICNGMTWFMGYYCKTTASVFREGLKDTWSDRVLGSFEDRQKKGTNEHQCTVSSSDVVKKDTQEEKAPVKPKHSITVRNGAGFMAWFDVWYMIENKWKKHYSGRYPVGKARSFTLPDDAKHIWVYLKGDSWNTQINKHYLRSPANNCYNITGTIFKGKSSKCST